MVNILLGILKVTGILLLSIIFLILLILLIVLLGPIGYYASGQYREEKECTAGVSWLGFVIRCRADYCKEKGLIWGVRLFGILLASNEETFLEKKEQKQKQKAERARIKAEKEAKRARKKAEKDARCAQEKAEKEARRAREKAEKEAMTVQPEETGHVQAEKKKTEAAGQVKPTETGLTEEKTGNVSQTPMNIQEVSGKTPQADGKKKIRMSVKEKAGRVKAKLQAMVERIKNIPANIRQKIELIKAKVNRFLEYKEFFFGEGNREGFLHILRHLKKLVVHILPRKIQGNVEFGVEDPYTMGQILTVLAIFYPAYQDKLTLKPDFEQAGFAADGCLKGRIIPGYLLLRILLAVCNREVIRIIKEGRQLIGGNES